MLYWMIHWLCIKWLSSFKVCRHSMMNYILGSLRGVFWCINVALTAWFFSDYCCIVVPILCTPIYLRVEFTPNTDVSVCHMKSMDNRIEKRKIYPPVSSHYGKQSFKCNGASLWNHLPSCLKNSDSLSFSGPMCKTDIFLIELSWVNIFKMAWRHLVHKVEGPLNSGPQSFNAQWYDWSVWGLAQWI